MRARRSSKRTTRSSTQHNHFRGVYYFFLTVSFLVFVTYLLSIEITRMNVELQLQAALSAPTKPVPSRADNSVFCGGIAAIQCPSGYACVLDGAYPDAGGHCVPNAPVTSFKSTEAL